MKGTYLGEFEELVLLTVGILYDDAYGLAIVDELEKQTGRNVMISSAHKALVRLEDKGYLKSKMGGATEQSWQAESRLAVRMECRSVSPAICLEKNKEVTKLK
jgi:hypothetical protein